MHTYEMVAVADENGRTYVSQYGTYNKQDGFRLATSYLFYPIVVDKLFHEDCWSIKKEVKEMTKEEIEKELGYEIKIIGRR